MSKIILTEDQLKLINEKLGIPDNIVETTNLIFSKIINYLKKNKDEVMFDNSLNFTVSDDFTISDYKFNSITIFINLDYKPFYRKTGINSISINNEFELDTTTMLMQDVNYLIDNNTIQFNLTVQSFRYKLSTIYNYFKKNKVDITVKLTHELKHQYDKYKNPRIKIGKLADYYSKARTVINIPPINQFIHAMYYTHDIEKLVRSSELYSLIKSGKVNKTNFKEFMSNNQTIIYLKKLKELNFDSTIQELKTSFLDDIVKFLQFENPELEIEGLSSDQLIKLFLKIVYLKISLSKNMFLNNYLEDFDSLSKENKKYIQKNFNVNNLDKYSDYFYAEQKKINKKADELIRKLYKLFDLTNTVTENKVIFDQIFKLNLI